MPYTIAPSAQGPIFLKEGEKSYSKENPVTMVEIFNGKDSVHERSDQLPKNQPKWQVYDKAVTYKNFDHKDFKNANKEKKEEVSFAFTLTGRYYPFPSGISVEHAKKFIEHQSEIRVVNQRLVYQGQIMKENEMIHPEQRIALVLKLNH